MPGGAGSSGSPGRSLQNSCQESGGGDVGTRECARMSEDPVLKALAEAARAEDPLVDARWERLAEGTASEEDAADLARLAALSDQHREMFETFRPLGADARRRIGDKILAGI